MFLLSLFACTTEVTEYVTEKVYVEDTAVETDPDFDGFVDDDCGPTNGAINPDATDVAGDGIDQNCDGVDGTDTDLDGVASTASGGDDCDDADADVMPGASDVDADGIDQDCDGNDGPILPTFVGDLTLGNDADEAWFCTQYSAVLGSLTVTAMDDASSLSCLRSVSANFTLTSAADSIDLPVLQSVGGEFSLYLAAPIVELPALESVGGSFYAPNALTTSEYHLASLTTVGGYVLIYSWEPTALHVVDMPVLTEAGGVESYMDTQGGSYNLPMLTTVTGSVTIGMTFTDVEEGAEPERATANFSSLTTVGGSFQYYDMGYWGDSPTDADFGSLASVAYFTVASLEDIEFPALASVTGDVSAGGPGIVSLPALVSPVEGIYADGTGGLSAPMIPSCTDVYVSGSYSVEYDGYDWIYTYFPGPAVLDLGTLSTASSVYIGGAALADLSGLDRLTSVASYIYIDSNTSLADISALYGLETVGAFYAFYNEPVTNADFQALVDSIPTVGETVIEGNAE
ncbi:hypothetical protein LBMAG42_32450 [Deltaproteobacteria bacterium]|nr:hypothetical protein LBMAG42_32450 [Deltaproteobacteria bacterium]